MTSHWREVQLWQATLTANEHQQTERGRQTTSHAHLQGQSESAATPSSAPSSQRTLATSIITNDTGRMSLRVVAFTLPALSGLLACDPCANVQGPFSAELGTGVDAFAPLTNGASVPYVRGPQGGTHVDGSVHVEGLYLPAADDQRLEELCLVSFTLQEGDTRVGGFDAVPRTFDIRDAADRVGDHVGEPVVFFEDASGFVGATLRLLVEVNDRCGHRVTDERQIVVRDAGT